VTLKHHSCIAVIGSGFMGTTHIDAWTDAGRRKSIKYVYSPSGRELPDEYSDLDMVRDLDLILNDPSVSFMSICTPTRTHVDIATEALERGRHVLLEKPVALDISEAVRLQEAAEKSGSILMVAHVARFFPGYQAVYKAAQQEIGPVRLVELKRISARPAWADWILDEEQSGGILVDFAIHDFDFANSLLGSPGLVESIQVDTGGPMLTTIHYQEGLASVTSHSDMPADFPFTSEVSVVGDSGYCQFRSGTAVETEGGYGTFELNGVIKDIATYIGEADAPQSNPYARQIEYFLQCVETGKQPTAPSFEAAVDALRVSLAAVNSLEDVNSTP